MSKPASPEVGTTAAAPVKAAPSAAPSAVDEARSVRSKLRRSAALRFAGVVIVPLVVQPWTPSTSPEQRASVVAFVGLVTASLFFVLPQLAAVTAFLRAQAARATAKPVAGTSAAGKSPRATGAAAPKSREDDFDRQVRTAKWQLSVVLTLSWLWIGWLASESVLAGAAIAVSLLPVVLVFASSMYRTAFVEWRTAVARDFLNSHGALFSLEDEDEDLAEDEDVDWGSGGGVSERHELTGSSSS